jgi:thiamine-monophosphate kinase
VQGEEAIIQGALARLSAGFPGALGLRDDAALIAVPPGHELVVTMDAVAAGVHFFESDAAADIAWKALAVNVSDVIAKGARPHAYLMSLAFPTAPDPAWLEQFAAGLAQAQSAFGLHLIGGDTDHRPGPLSVTITAMGLVPTGTMVKRGGAEPGDTIFVSGTLGDAALGLMLRADRPETKAWPLDEAGRRALVKRYLRPSPRVALAPALRAYARAAMDISDGLVKDLARMTALSGVGAEVATHRLPLSPAAAKLLEHDPGLIAQVAAGGDDYEVLAALSPDNVSAFQTAARDAGITVTSIGRIVGAAASGVLLIGPDDVPLKLARTGYDHF